MKFTNRSLQALKPQAGRYTEWKDSGEGFGIRVTPKGRKSFIYMFRFDGRPRMMTLGTYPKVSLADANEKHAKARKQLEKGIDPGEVQVEANQEARKALTVKQLVDEYIEKWAKPRKRSWQEDKRILEKDVVPIWGHRKAKDITRRNVITLLDSIMDRNAPIAANKTLAIVRKMFNFAIGRDIVQTTPCVAVIAPSPVQQRDRVLSETEIKTFWETLSHTAKDDNNLKMSTGTRLALKLQLLTAQRRAEVVNAKWTDIDQGWWTIPAERSKNKLPHRVPLSPMALELLQKIRKMNTKSEWLFPSPHRKKTVAPDDSGYKPITPHSISYALLRNMDKLRIDRFTPHDLRRTAASQMTAMGISRLTVAKLLNHVESGVTSVYDRHSYDQEKKQALDAWSAKLETILHGKQEDTTVVELRA